MVRRMNPESHPTVGLEWDILRPADGNFNLELMARG